MDTRVPSGSWRVKVFSTRSARVTAVDTTLVLSGRRMRRSRPASSDGK